MFDLHVSELKDRIVADCNTSGLPLSVIAYILQEIAQQVSVLAQQQIQAQKKERDKQKSAEKEE